MAVAAPFPRRVGGDNTHLWLAGGGLLVVLACLAALAAAILAGGPRAPQRYHLPPALVPAPRPDDANVLLNNTTLAITPTDAVAINAERPVDRLRVTAARPFLLTPSPEGAGTGGAALNCLAQAIYYEAASESDAGERAVAQVVLNRVRNPLFPHSVCGVVFQGSQQRTGCQFSFTCDGNLARRPSLAGWARARRIAASALGGWVERSVGLSTHYHADYVVPYWASSLDKVRTIGAHIFYVMRGQRGRPGSFAEPYDAAAEGPPMLAAPSADVLNGVADAAIAGAAPPRDRTVVQEDALGTLTAPVMSPATPAGTLKADEATGQLVVDRKPDAAEAPR